MAYGGYTGKPKCIHGFYCLITLCFFWIVIGSDLVEQLPLSFRRRARIFTLVFYALYPVYAWVYVKYLNKHSSIETDTSGHMMENTGETANQDTNGHSMDSFLSGTNRESKYAIES